MTTQTIHPGDALAILRTLPANSVHCIVTSPPYYGLRDYGVPGQIGMEETIAAYVAKMVEVFEECRRVLRDDGTLWLNLGDSYAGSGGAGEWSRRKTGKQEYAGPRNNNVNRTAACGLKPKNLIGIPWRIADALRIEPEDWQGARGYFLRMGMITIDDAGAVTVTNYTKRQEPKDPTAAERMRRYRDKDRTQPPVTPDVTRNVTRKLRVEAEAEAEAEELLAPDPDFADTYRFWCDKTTRSSGNDAVSMQAVFDEWKSIFNPEDIRAAILIAAQAKGMAATPAYLAGILRKQANARKNGNGALRMYEEAAQ